MAASRGSNWRQLLMAGCSATVLLLAVVASQAYAADGGRGGGGGSAGGTESSAAGEHGATSAHGGGGGAAHPDGSGDGGDGHAGGDGGSGGAHGYIGDGADLPDTDIVGAHGGDGRYHRDNGAGGGGGGGYGVAITPASGAAMQIDQTITGGDGGHGGHSRSGHGGGGGAGGGGLHFGGLPGNDLTLSGNVLGGHGGPSGTAAFEALGGNAGEAVRFSGGTLAVSGTVTGGEGGFGGFGTGGGGAGGAGILFDGTRLDLTGVVFGGHGGDGRDSMGTWSAEPGGFGGQGGAAIAAASGGVITLSTGAEIRGGNGGEGGLGGVAGLHGAGGEGIIGADLTVITAGSIVGGLGNAGGGRANAITFTDGTNRLELHEGYSFDGDVVANGRVDTLAIGGSSDTSFAVGGIGSQYQGFEAFEKTGSRVLTLTGTTAAMTPWTVRQGTLSVSSDAQLGDVAGGLRLDGGALGVTESFDSARRVTLDGNGSLAVGDGVIFGFSGALDGAGTLAKLGNGTFVFSGDATNYQGGPLHIDGGAFLANAVAGGSNLDVTVSDGAMLGGTGSLGNIRINSGGTYAPGNSIAVQRTGDVAFAAGSIYEVEVNDGGFVAGTNYDSIESGGAVAIEGGTVRITPENGTDNGLSYTPGDFTIISADGGVTGAFDALEEDFVFLDMVLGYDSNAVVVQIAKTQDLSDVAETDNEHAVADAVEEPGGALHDALLGIVGDEDAAREALNDLSGEGHASIQSALLTDGRFMRDAAIGRLRSAFGAELPSVPVDLGGGIIAFAPAEPDPYTAWGQTFGGWERINSDGNAAVITGGTGGLMIGAETFVLDNMLAGVMVGYARSGYEIAEREMIGTANSVYLGAYGGSQFENVNLRFGGGYMRNAIETERTVAFTGFSDELSASYSSNQLEAFAEVGYEFDIGTTSFEPFVNLAHVRLNTEGFTESGGLAALTSADSANDATFAVVGVYGERDLIIGTIPTTFRGRVGWQHAFGDLTPHARMRFGDDDAFTVSGAPVASDALVIGYDAEFAVSPSATLDLGYNGQFGAGASDHILKATFGISF